MAFSKNDSKNLGNYLKENDYRPSTSGNSYSNNSGSSVKPSETGGSWSVNGNKYTDLSSLKKSGRI